MGYLFTMEQKDYQRIASELFHCKRLAIVGNQGAGKTTLAEKLANLLGIEFVEWYPDQATAFQERLSRQERWIVDGEFGVLNHADQVIFLDFPLSLCLWRAAKRSLFGSIASPQKLRRIPSRLLRLLGLLSEIFKASSRPCPGTGSSWMPNAETIVLTSPKQVDLLLDALHALGVRRDTEFGC